MELTPKQQTVELVKKSENILITTSQDARGDGIASSLALVHILEKMGKQVIFLLSEGIHKSFHFLPGIEKVKEDFLDIRDFIISLSLDKTKVERISYKVDGDKLHFFISPRGNNFEEEDVSFSYGNFKFDLVMVLDSPDLENLGNVYDSNTEIFHNMPIINIDHHSGNDYFGTVNLVDLQASSTSEILVSVIESLDPKLVDENVATCLLAGIISSTNSFQSSNTTPKSLTVTAQLIAAGANHENVVRNLFKTKSFQMLKIWGSILSNVKIDKQNKILWSEVSQDELKDQDSREIAQGVLDELLTTAPNIKVYFLFLERDNSLKVFVKTSRDVEAGKITYLFGGSGRAQNGEFEVNTKDREISKVLENILERVKEFLEEAIPEV